MGKCCVVISAITHISFFLPPPKDREQIYRRQLQPHGARAEDGFTPSDPLSALIPVAVLGQAYSAHSNCPRMISAALGLRKPWVKEKKKKKSKYQIHFACAFLF